MPRKVTQCSGGGFERAGGLGRGAPSQMSRRATNSSSKPVSMIGRRLGSQEWFSIDMSGKIAIATTLSLSSSTCAGAAGRQLIAREEREARRSSAAPRWLRPVGAAGGETRLELVPLELAEHLHNLLVGRPRRPVAARRGDEAPHEVDGVLHLLHRAAARGPRSREFGLVQLARGACPASLTLLAKSGSPPPSAGPPATHLAGNSSVLPTSSLHAYRWKARIRSSAAAPEASGPSGPPAAPPSPLSRRMRAATTAVAGASSVLRKRGAESLLIPASALRVQELKKRTRRRRCGGADLSLLAFMAEHS